MNGFFISKTYLILLSVVLTALPAKQVWGTIPILRIGGVHQEIDKKTLETHIWVLSEVDAELKLTDVRRRENQFKPYSNQKANLDPAKTHWALLQVQNDSPSPVDYVLYESNESEMQVFIMESGRLIYAGQSGQLVKLSEEQVPEGISWEARVHIHLQAGQYQEIYLRANHVMQMTQVFDLRLERLSDHEKSIHIRNLLQTLFQGALGLLLLFHLLLFGVSRQKAYALFSLYCWLQLLFFQYFYGLSKEWFWGEWPELDLAYAAIPILIPSTLILTSIYLLDEKSRRSTEWKKLKIFNWLSILLFALALFLLYRYSWAKYGFRLVSVFILFNPIFVFYFLRKPIIQAKLDTKFFLLGTLILSLIASLSSALFFTNELVAGGIVQLAILLQIIFFALGLGYRQVKTLNSKDEAQQSLQHQLRLKEAFEQDLKTHFEQKVKARTAALEDQKNALIIAKRQAEKANQFKSDLLAMIQYDIRTPLHAILGMSSLLQERQTQEDRQQMVNTLHIASDNLLGLVNNILDYSQIEGGSIRLEHDSIILQEMVDHLLDNILPLCQQKDLALTLNYDPEIPYELFGSQTRLLQVLSNLLHNAAKFTDAGKIDFSIQQKERSPHQALLHFSISDEGCGIAPADQKTIFRGLKKEKSSLSSPHQGRGLGLAIVAKLLELQGSQIQLKSELGKGSTFYFDLWLGLSSGKKRQQKASLQNKKVLLVEDNLVNQDVALAFLKQWGMQVSLAKNGVEALQKVDEESFDLILLDLHMPIMDGYEAASIIGQHERAAIRDIPIIALSANTDQSSRRKAKAAGIRRFIAKPFNPKDLKQTIEAALVK